MVSRDGQVKILDFGLSKWRRTTQDSTTTDLTDESMALGTAGYMSHGAGTRRECRPSFGNCSISALPATVPAALSRIVRRCLEREPDRKFQSAADLGFALQALSLSLARATPPKKKTLLKWVVVASAFVRGTALFWLTRPLPPPRGTGLIQITRDGRLTESTVCPLLTDGSRLFFCTGDNVRAYQISVNGAEPVPVVLAYVRRPWGRCDGKGDRELRCTAVPDTRELLAGSVELCPLSRPTCEIP